MGDRGFQAPFVGLGLDALHSVVVGLLVLSANLQGWVLIALLKQSFSCMVLGVVAVGIVGCHKVGVTTVTEHLVILVHMFSEHFVILLLLVLVRNVNFRYGIALILFQPSWWLFLI